MSEADRDPAAVREALRSIRAECADRGLQEGSETSARVVRRATEARVMDRGANGVNAVVEAYVGRGTRPWPQRDRAAAERAARLASLPAEAVDVAEAWADEASAIPLDWTRMSLVDAGEHVITVMRSRHPELSEDGAGALAWYVTYQWR
jgi:hypothetical protein